MNFLLSLPTETSVRIFQILFFLGGAGRGMEVVVWFLGFCLGWDFLLISPACKTCWRDWEGRQQGFDGMKNLSVPFWKAV